MYHKLIEQAPDEGRAWEAPQSRRQTDLSQYCGTLKRSAGGRVRPVSETKEVSHWRERQDIARASYSNRLGHRDLGNSIWLN
jgi:hypothetical protein